MTMPPFQPLPCDSAGGAGGADVEQIVLCDLDAEGNLLGTAVAVYQYDENGAPAGPPTFVDPATGDPYVVQGTLQPCPDAACLPPIQFCQTSTSTGPVDHPGRQYDITLPINPGFAVQSLQVDAVSHAAGITWEVDDPDGEVFRQTLTSFIEGRVPAAATVTITNPNAGVPQVCGAALPMQIHIECVRLDQNPPDLIELVYNGGQDLIQNPAYNEFPALDPPVSQGNYGFHLLSRQDDPGPFPGNPPAGQALCTNTANRGWETNDVGRTFEIWGQDVSNGQNTTPTPRGTPVQEITSDGPPPGGRSTIWQTFQAPATGPFVIRVVHGARDPGEQHRITLDNGDTDDAQNGDLIDDISNPPSVTSSGGPNPWTQFSQTIPLNAGSTYTLALSTNNPAGGARGGLFTDMRAYIDRPDLRATATTDDDTCVVTVEETTTTTTCSYWQPQCAGGVIAGWQRPDTGETLSNAEFWAQVPTPSCCLPAPGGDGEGSSALSNMLTSDLVCATVGGIEQTAIRVMVTDPSGGTLQALFLSADGAPIAPASWTPGPCCCGNRVTLGPVCFDDPNAPFPQQGFLVRDADGSSHVFDLSGNEIVPFPTILICADQSYFEEILCDAGNGGHQFIRRYTGSPVAGLNSALFDFELDGITAYVPVGPVEACSGPCRDESPTLLCDVTVTDAETIFDPQNIAGADGWDLVAFVPTAPGGFPADTPPVSPAATGTNEFGQASLGARADMHSSNTGVAWPGYDSAIGRWILRKSFNAAEDGTAHVAATLFRADGGARVRINGQDIGIYSQWGQPGTSGDFTAPVTAGANTVEIEVRDDWGWNWVTGRLDISTTRSERFFRRNVYDCATGEVVGTIDTTLDGQPYTVLGDVVACEVVEGDGCCPQTPGQSVELRELCDDDGGVITRFLRAYVYPDGSSSPLISDTLLDGVTPYEVAGTVGSCDAAAGVDVETFPLCVLDNATGNVIQDIRAEVVYDSAGVVTAIRYVDAVDGSPVAVPGGAHLGVCPSAGADAEPVQLCDSNGTRFLRTYTYGSAGAVAGFADTDLDGAVFVPSPPVGACGQTVNVQDIRDSESIVLCDADGTQFVRTFVRDGNGAIVATTNTTLGGAAFVPVEPVERCADCCPAVVGEGCWDDGATIGRHTAVRLPDGTIELLDQADGHVVDPADVVACTGGTAQAHMVNVTPGSPWTPAAIPAGTTLTGLSLSVLAGTADVVDADGTAVADLPAGYAASWDGPADGTLDPPQSITADAASRAVVVMVVRPS